MVFVPWDDRDLARASTSAAGHHLMRSRKPASSCVDSRWEAFEKTNEEECFLSSGILDFGECLVNWASRLFVAMGGTGQGR